MESDLTELEIKVFLAIARDRKRNPIERWRQLMAYAKSLSKKVGITLRVQDVVGRIIENRELISERELMDDIALLREVFVMGAGKSTRETGLAFSRERAEQAFNAKVRKVLKSTAAKEGIVLVPEKEKPKGRAEPRNRPQQGRQAGKPKPLPKRRRPI